MGIVDNNPVNATYTNSRLVSKQNDNTLLGKLTLNRTGSGGQILDVQQDVNDLNTNVATLTSQMAGKIDSSEKGVANGVASLNASGKIPDGQIPALAITDVYAVADIAARNALTVEEGDVAIVQDQGDGNPNTYIYDGTSWLEIEKPTNAGTNSKTEYRTISGGEASAKQLTLSETPSVVTEVILDVIGGGPQFYGDDFSVSSNILSWNGLGLDGLLSSGDKVRIQYLY